MIKNSIDFVIPQFTMRIPFMRRHVENLVRSIHKYTKDPYTIYIMNNGINEGVQIENKTKYI